MLLKLSKHSNTVRQDAKHLHPTFAERLHVTGFVHDLLALPHPYEKVWGVHPTCKIQHHIFYHKISDIKASLKFLFCFFLNSFLRAKVGLAFQKTTVRSPRWNLMSTELGLM